MGMWEGRRTISDDLQRRAAVLFVDDESKSRKYFKRVFGGDREILTATNGCEALELYREHAGAISVVITDQIMPRLTGLELLRELLESGSPVVRILSTAYTDSDLIQEAVNGGLVDYFVGKPWDLEKLEVVLLQAEHHYLHRLKTGPDRGQVA